MNRPKSFSWLLGWASLGAVTLLYWSNLRELPMRLAWQFFPDPSVERSDTLVTGAFVPPAAMGETADENSDEPDEIQVSFGGVTAASDSGTDELSGGGLTPRSVPTASATQSGNSGSRPGAVAGPIEPEPSGGGGNGGPEPVIPPANPATPPAPVTPNAPNQPSPVAPPPNNGGSSASDGGGIEVVIPIQNPLGGEPIVEIAIRENLIPTLLDLNRGEKISLNFLSPGGDDDATEARSIELTVLGDEVVLNHSDQIALLDALDDGEDESDAEKIPIKFQVNHDQGNLELQLPDAVRDNFDIELAIQGEDHEESSILDPVESLLQINLPLI